ncbi:HTH-type transcriptional regulator YesS [Peptococcaceae bacterium CEB3]|nr:HTH-type transcriptional regulator YesS [Peptococcaceae bacterium CEB3]
MNGSVNIYESFIDPQYLDEVLGSFSKATGLNIEVVSNRGETFAIPGGNRRCEFCQHIRKHPKGEKKCIESYRRATLEAAKWNEPYFFRCHAGLVIWAVPIVMEQVILGSIICGQVLMWEPDPFFLEELRTNFRSMGIATLEGHVSSLSIISPDQAQAAADMLYVVVNHLVKKQIHIQEQENAYRLQRLQIRKDLEERKKKDEVVATDWNQYLKKERRFLRFIRLGDESRAEKDLQSLLADLFTVSAGDKTTIKTRITELASLTSRAAVEGGADAKQVMVMLEDFADEVGGLERVEEFFSKMNALVIKFLQGIFKMADKKHLSLVKSAREYVMENYHKPLTIKDVSDHLFISPSHLSRLFRQELDCTFNDFLTRVRIEKAVELVKKREFSVQEAANAVGFKSQSYFAKVFRRYIGVTPLVYKNSLF